MSHYVCRIMSVISLGMSGMGRGVAVDALLDV